MNFKEKKNFAPFLLLEGETSMKEGHQGNNTYGFATSMVFRREVIVIILY